MNRRTVIKSMAGALLTHGVTRGVTAAQSRPVVSLPPRRPIDFRPFADALARVTPQMRCRLDAFVLENGESLHDTLPPAQVPNGPL